MERKDYVILALMFTTVFALAGAGYIAKSTNHSIAHDCLVITSHDKQTRLDVVKCAQVTPNNGTIKIVPIR